MVIANDDMPLAPALQAECREQASPTYVGTRREPRAYSNSEPQTVTGRSVAIVRVTDDFGERIEIRVGEAVILGTLFESVLEELRMKRANEE